VPVGLKRVTSVRVRLSNDSMLQPARSRRVAMSRAKSAPSAANSPRQMAARAAAGTSAALGGGDRAITAISNIAKRIRKSRCTLRA